MPALASLFARPTPPASFTAPLAPDSAFYVTGDIHGRLDLLETQLERIARNRRTLTPGAQAAGLVFLGDYIDRGPDSAGVLRRLMSLSSIGGVGVTCLMGNHERMMLDFLDDPIVAGPIWLRHGGVDTLNSFGISVSGRSGRGRGEDLIALADTLQAALPKGMEPWLRALPLIWCSGNVCCVHAAMDPRRPRDRQDERTLLWGHHDFLHQPRRDRIWVVHGHTIVKRVQISGGRIAMDTGAWRGGGLSSALIADGDMRVLPR